MINDPDNRNSKNEILMRLALIVALILFVMFGIMIAHMVLIIPIPFTTRYDGISPPLKIMVNTI